MKGYRHAANAAALAGTLLVAGCTAPNEDPAPEITGPVVTITDMAYDPAQITVAIGDTVTWVFDDRGRAHDVVGTDATSAFLRSPLKMTGTWTHTFTEPGTFNYTCSPHPGMRGTVIVE